MAGYESGEPGTVRMISGLGGDEIRIWIGVYQIEKRIGVRPVCPAFFLCDSGSRNAVDAPTSAPLPGGWPLIDSHAAEEVLEFLTQD